MREALLGVAVGKKGIGKSYTTEQIIGQYIKGSGNVKPRRALILDVNDEFEDINKYIGDYLPNDLVGAICTNRHTDVDIIMHYQSIGRITTKIWQNINWLRFHKNTDSVDRHKKKFEDKYEALKIMEIMINNQYFNGNTRFYLTFDCDNEKILGTYSAKMMSDSIDEYIALNHRTKVKPLLNQVDKNGKKIYTPLTATQQVKKQLLKMYVK